MLTLIQISGSAASRSQVGLIRALLHDILVQEPSLTDEIVSNLEISDSMETLWYSLEYITRSNALNQKFCFFIDGLDEFDGPPREIGDFVCKLSSIQTVKICVSSRPWNEFASAFETMSSNVLKVHEHTKQDMCRYVNDLLEQDKLFVRLRDQDSGYQQIVSRIVERAQGVFLWVFLVVRDLRNNLANEDTVVEFQQRVDCFPDDLEGYFTRMFDSIPMLYKRQALQVLLLLLANEGALDLIELSPSLNKDCAVLNVEDLNRSPLHFKQVSSRTVQGLTLIAKICLAFTIRWAHLQRKGRTAACMNQKWSTFFIGL